MPEEAVSETSGVLESISVPEKTMGFKNLFGGKGLGKRQCSIISEFRRNKAAQQFLQSR